MSSLPIARGEDISRSSSGSGSDRSEGDEGFGSLKRYIVEPPKDLIPLHKRLKLGHPGLNLQSPDQIEDQLNSEKIRTGFFEKFLFKNEASNVVELMFDQFMDRTKLVELGSFMTSAMRRQRDLGVLRASGSPNIEKITLTEDERTRWLESITNPERPFAHLQTEASFGVPHGVRIEQVIKTLAERKCSMNNAVWIFRLMYNSEQKIKNIPFPQVTAESTTQLMRVLERGMADLRGAKSEAVEKHAARWSYYTALSCRLYSQDLVDQKQFLRWLVDGLSSSTSKGALLVPILVALLSEFARSRALSLLLIRALTPACEQASPTCQPFAAFCRGILEAMLVQMPDVFVGTGPRHPRPAPDWTRILTGSYQYQNTVYLTIGMCPTPESIASAAEAVMRRNRRFTTCPSECNPTIISWSTPSSPFPTPINLSTDLGEVARTVFHTATPSDWGSVFRVARELLLYVAHFGKRDPDLKYLTCGLLRVWAGVDCHHQEAVEAALLRFLDEWSGEGREQVLDTFGQLIRQGTFSFLRYLRRAVARGYLTVTFSSPKCAERHLEYLRTLPAYAADKETIHQRTATLQLGDHDYVDSLLSVICTRLPAILDPSSRNPAQIAPTADPPHGAPAWTEELLDQLRSASGYVRGEIVASLVSGITTYIIKDVQIGEDNWRVISKPGTALVSVREFALVAEVLEACQEIGALLEISAWVLVNTEERTLLPLLVHIFRRHQPTLIACGFSGVVLAALWRKHQEFKATLNHIDKSAAMFLLHLVFNNAPGSTYEIRNELESSLQALIAPTRPLNGVQEIPDYVAELYDPPSDATALRSRAASLCMRYRSVPGWWGRLFYNATQLINLRVTASEGPSSKLLQLVRNYSHLFYFLADFTLDTQTVVLEWARGLLLSPSSSTKWLIVFLVLLAARSLCSLPTILSLVLPPTDHPVTPDHPLLRSDTLLLLRLLLVGDAILPDGTSLCAQDFFALRLTRFTCFGTVDSLAPPFQLLYQLASLEAAFPASEDLHALRMKLASVEWLTHVGRKFSSAIYRRYMLNGTSPFRTSVSCPKVIPLLTETFAKVLGEVEINSRFTLESSDFTHPDGHAAFNRNLILTGLHLDKLTCGDPEACLDEINSYVQTFFCQWVDDLKLPMSLLLQAVQAIPSDLYPRVLQYANSRLRDPESSSSISSCTMYAIKNSHEAAKRFKLVIQTLLHSVSADPGWQQAKINFGMQLFEDLEPFGPQPQDQHVMLAAECPMSLARDYVSKNLNPNTYEISLHITEKDRAGFGVKEIFSSIELRLELLAPILPILVNGASHDLRLRWIKTILELLTCPILMDPANNSLFEFALDFFAFLFAEIPKESKTDTFSSLRSFLSVLPKCVIADPRLARLFPFGTQHSIPEHLFKEPESSKVARPYNPWEWDQGLVLNELPFPLSRFQPKHLSKPASAYISDPSDSSLLLEPQHLEPPLTSATSQAAPLPRTASTTISTSRMKYAKTAASPLKSFRATGSSPLNSLHAPSPKIPRNSSNLAPSNPQPPPYGN
ncbi:hypothetical protein DSO57_1011759 [Entomophthora muscae]|uniref:Uncharacterized protein n=1 Tax=Entomophthora muscae TaxID=34485 RepID=A0ACC2SVB4_9FUNG|nr:hypothetical protein DSO57_1011759 [Entomophthora muscae]